MESQETADKASVLESKTDSSSKQHTGEGAPLSPRTEVGGIAEGAEPEGFQFYHMDLYEPRGRLEIFSDKQSEAGADDDHPLALQDAAAGAPRNEKGPKAELLSFGSYRGDYGCPPSPEAEFGTSQKFIEFSNNFPVDKQFDPFQQIVDYSESASQYSEGLLSPRSEPSGLEESEAEITTAQCEEHLAERVRALRTLRNTESEMEPDDEEIVQDSIPDIYCRSCDIPIPAFEKLFGFHKHHSVMPLAEGASVAKLECQNNLKKLENQLIQMETFSNHLEEIFVTVEENIGKQEHYLELQYDDLMQCLVQRFEDRSQDLQEQKNLKLERLYDLLVSCGHSMDGYKQLMESINTLFQTENKQSFLKSGQMMLTRLEDFLQEDLNPEFPTALEFENFSTDMGEVQRLMDSISSIPVPSAPSMCPQLPDTATSSSVRVRWSLSADDTVEHYRLYYRKAGENTQDGEATDMSLRVKEMFCTVRNLQPGSVYLFWVTASNCAGTSEESDRVEYMTVPSAPLISSRGVAVCQSAVLMEWEPGPGLPPQSYTVEFCQICSGCNWTESLMESLTGITSCQTLIELEPNENYIFYIRSVNRGGSSERSEPITVRTTGTQLYLLEQSAHLSLSILQDGLTIVYSEESLYTEPSIAHERFTSAATVMAQLVPVRGRHYWEVEVDEDMEYRIGVASTDMPRDSHLGSNLTSWCMRHIRTPSRSKFEFLHKGWTPDLRITVTPTRIGILLDYNMGKLSFFNANVCQLLFTFSQHFQNFVNPCFALESYGILKIYHNIPLPEFTKLL
ncbi:fibronectin type III and SPRY domain-containing protein 2 [Hypanus sabinus]|uniref:fibronectin type III and SPRY domain-containing protein 2 n=1 Tax=Hypanus sabinus TaxID=79690 RepID=UPI0028C485C9|nr:fibronectin type III and SPRY domain-containing protein 2 [Hypanus sabinus]